MKNQNDGLYPVRVLRENLLQWFVKLGNVSELEHEITYNGLNPKIIYKVTDYQIVDMAEIEAKDKNQITVYENFCQFLWSFTYFVLVFYDEGFVRSSRENFIVTKGNVLIDNAIASLEAVIELFSSPKRHKFYELPNPESTEFTDDFYVNKTNDVYSAAMSFILLHETGHQFFGHLEYEPESKQQNRKEEEDADDYAFEVLSKHFETAYGLTVKTGIVVSLVALIFTRDNLSGEEVYPDSHQRLKRIIERMDLSENDNLWAVAAVCFKLWAVKYNKSLDFPESFNFYKELFDKTFQELK